MTLYLKYRSKTIEELDLEKVRSALLNIFKSGSIPHAFLFSGPKGSGKTSAARIVAKIINCENPDKKSGEPCNKCANCSAIAKGEYLDVIEIDAASHRGIDDIRIIRDAVKLSPVSGKKKVYIIDEAHMLTTEASNALLKTLEEPPEHVVFILATTNPEKLIETVRSRTVNIAFSKAGKDEIVRSLSRVIEGEKIKAEKETLAVIASASDGSFRDAIKILEELVIRNIKIDKKEVEDYLFGKKIFNTDEFIGILNAGDEKKAYGEIEKAVESGMSVKNLTALLLGRLKEMLLAKVGLFGEDKSLLSKEEILTLLGLFSRSYSEVSYAVLEQIPLELAVSEWFAGRCKNTITEINGKKGDSVKKIKTAPVEEKAIRSKKDINISESNSAPTDNLTLDGFDDGIWSRILGEIRSQNTSTEALLRAAKPVGYDGKTLTLGVYYKFHKERLETNPHRNILETVLQGITGSGVRVICTLTDPPARSSYRDDSKQETEEEPVVLIESGAVLSRGEDDEIVKAAKEIFGS